MGGNLFTPFLSPDLKKHFRQLLPTAIITNYSKAVGTGENGRCLQDLSSSHCHLRQCEEAATTERNVHTLTLHEIPKEEGVDHQGCINCDMSLDLVPRLLSPYEDCGEESD